MVKAYSETGKRCLVMVRRSWRRRTRRGRDRTNDASVSALVGTVSARPCSTLLNPTASTITFHTTTSSHPPPPAPKTHLDQRQMQPKRLSLSGERSTLLEGGLHEGEVRSLEEGSGGSNGIRGVGDDDIEGVLDGGEVLESVGDVDGDLGVGENVGHSGEVELRDSGDGLFSKVRVGRGVKGWVGEVR